MVKWYKDKLKVETPSSLSRTMTFNPPSIISALSQEEKEIFFSSGAYGHDLVFVGVRKLIAEIKRLREELKKYDAR